MKRNELTETRRRELTELSRQLGIDLKNLSLLDTALTHTSYANESLRRSVSHNERLEYLGDAVLELAMSDYLYKHYPNLSEGDLTKARASVVCEETLSCRAAEIRLGEHLLLGNGERASGGDKRPSILADTFEAVIGAIYLDQGWETARNYIFSQLETHLKEIRAGQQRHDFKTILQEMIQRRPGRHVLYELLAADGPDHAKTFTVRVSVNGTPLGAGQGRSKKEAEQAAAKEALGQLKQEENYALR